MADQDGGGSSIWLSFLEKSHPINPKFPNKVGGRPVWITPKDIPSEEHMRCSYCEETMSLLLQIYAPIEHKEEAYHRAIYLFACKKGACYKKGNKCLKALRTQLPQHNDFYAEDTDEEEDDPEKVKKSKDLQNLINKRKDLQSQICDVCGFYGPKRCGKCKVSRYCSQKHQIEHWKNGHNKECEQMASLNEPVALESHKLIWSKRQFKECCLEAEEEVLQNADSDIADKNTAIVLPETMNVGSNVEIDEKSFKKANQDKCFSAFSKRTSHNPEQVLRYYSPINPSKRDEEKDSVPLYVSEQNQPTENSIPNCEHCKSKRLFELQLTPQLLYFQGVDQGLESADDIDWGTLIVYTCSGYCNNKTYNEEFVWIQQMGENKKET